MGNLDSKKCERVNAQHPVTNQPAIAKKTGNKLKFADGAETDTEHAKTNKTYNYNNPTEAIKR